MQTHSLKISKVFSTGGDVVYVLPHFQREYAWEKENWKTLLTDVLGIYDAYSSDEAPPEHFMGSLVVINDGVRNGVIPAFRLVDGQQRLVTVSLMLCALGRLVEASHPNVTTRVRKLLTNPDESGDLYYKLLPTTKYGDRAAYLAIIKGDLTLPPNESRIPVAFEYLRGQLANWMDQKQADAEKLFKALTNCLQVVFIDLDQKERPYEIFESLNAKGKPLSQADLVRNYIAMRLPEAMQEEAFDKHWSVVETLLQERRTVGRSRLGELTAFLRHYLAMDSGVLCNEEHVYARFRDRVEKKFSAPAAFVDELIVLKRYATYYDRLLRPGREPRKAISDALTRLDALEIATGYPFLLALYNAMDAGTLREPEFLDALQTLENYMVRRFLANEPYNYLNKMFPTLWRELDPKQFNASLRRALSTKNYPSDSRLRQAAASGQLYDKRSATQKKIALVLETINRSLSAGSGGFTALDGAPTIEHVMPQTLSEEWQKELGPAWRDIHEEYLHILGNLTLVTQEWNSQLSNAAFATKRGKLASHELRLNKDYFVPAVGRWDREAILARAAFLADKVTELWPSLGEPPTPLGATGTKPKSVAVLGELHTVQSWRDVAFYTAECIAQVADDFDSIAERMPGYFSRKQFQSACRQLSNGWWIYLNLSGNSVKKFCRQLLNVSGIREDNWVLEEETV